MYEIHEKCTHAYKVTSMYAHTDLCEETLWGDKYASKVWDCIELLHKNLHAYDATTS